MPSYLTPGVYIKEMDKFPNQVSQVETAVPVFIGYTEKATTKASSVLNKPCKVSSFAEYELIYGSFPRAEFDWTQANNKDAFELNVGAQAYYMRQVSPRFQLYKSIKLFFQNGGVSCYIIAVGNYQDSISSKQLIAGIQCLAKQHEPTLLAIPESVSLGLSDCSDVQNAQITHCSNAHHLVSILDTYQQETIAETATQFRQSIAVENRSSFAAAYTPYLNTMAIPIKGMNLGVFAEDARQQLVDLLLTASTNMNAELKTIIKAISSPEKSRFKDADIHKILYSSSSVYRYLIGALHESSNIVPPSGAVVGAIVQTDINRGVWKAPANLNLNGVISPTLTITEQQQNVLNADQTGISINAIRTFVGSGTLIWGARTLDGNNNEYRYINVRRTLIMIEQSLQMAVQAYVFEPNDANTWTAVKGMSANYLASLWRNGALAGATASDAYAVKIGLGSTMTANDIQNGLMILTIHIALMRPAEFLHIEVSQKMKT